MSQCIKCGREIPQGELFCLECSMNPDPSVTPRPRQEQPAGRMQAPRPVKRQQPRSAPAPAPAREKPRKRRGLIVALVLVSLLLVASTVMQILQMGTRRAEENRLRAKEADLALREAEVEDLHTQVDDLTKQLDALNVTIADKEQEIQDLMSRLADSKSSQSQGEYDLSTAQQELVRLEEENKQLLALSDDLKEQINTHKKTITELENQVKAAKAYETKSKFLDTYVVFVENDKTGCYHTYDCANFAKSSFWAYSRKLAEAQGFTPCPTCGGTP